MEREGTRPRGEGQECETPPAGAGVAEEVGPGRLGFESQAEVQGLLLRVRGPWGLGRPGQVCVWERLLWGPCRGGEGGRECGTHGDESSSRPE